MAEPHGEGNIGLSRRILQLLQREGIPSRREDQLVRRDGKAVESEKEQDSVCQKRAFRRATFSGIERPVEVRRLVLQQESEILQRRRLKH